jgi:hypothetical protein
MTQDQENVTSMFETTLAYLKKNSTLWAGKAALTAAITDATNGVAGIRSAAARQETPTSGIKDDKDQLRNDLEDQTLVIADQVAALAADLLAKVQMTPSSLDQAQDDDLIQTAQRVETAATAHLAALAPYEITATEITALGGAITAFSDKKNAPRTATSERKGSTGSVAAQIRATRGIFRNRIDKMMRIFQKPNPEFYAGYLAARVIVDRPGTQGGPPSPPPPPAPPHP